MKRHIASVVVFTLLCFLSVFVHGAEPKSKLYFPDGDWEKVSPEKAGWDAVKIEEALELAGKRKSSGVVILHRGKIMAEKYWPVEAPQPAKAKDYSLRVKGRDPQGGALEDVASVQKSVSAVLAGIAQRKNLLKIDDRVDKYLGTNWSKASPEQEKEITIRHLLTMSSGLAEDLSFEAPAGTKWRYNSTAYAHVIDVIMAATKKGPNEFTGEWLTVPLGMKDSRWADRMAAGPETKNARGFITSARDLARFGLMVLANGQWKDGQVIVDSEYLKSALKPSQTLNPSYGYLWWLNGQPEVARGAGQKTKGPLIPSAPSDLVAALGALDRKVYVVPSHDLVVTRLGAATGAGFDNEFWKLLSAAAPKK